jgi:hypothetical protein
VIVAVALVIRRSQRAIEPATTNTKLAWRATATTSLPERATGIGPA